MKTNCQSEDGILYMYATMLNICMRVNGIMGHDKKQRENADEVYFKSS